MDDGRGARPSSTDKTPGPTMNSAEGSLTVTAGKEDA